MNKFLALPFLLCVSNLISAQDLQIWKIKKIISLDKQIGLAQPNTSLKQLMSDLRRSKFVYIKGTMLSFSEKFSKSEWYDDSVVIGESHTVPVMDDNDVSLKYPGDELTCEPSRKAENKCFVGRSFMKLLGSNDPTLTYYDLKSPTPNSYLYKLCIVKKNECLGLLFENIPLLLILAR